MACSGGGPAASSAASVPAPAVSTTSSSVSPVSTTAPPTTAPPTTRLPPPTGLVDLGALDPSILVALDNLTTANVTGAPLPGYEANRAFLRPEMAEPVVRAHRALASQGLGIKVFDAYRPARATRALVDWARRTGRGDLVGPYIAERSDHNFGRAIDCTLFDRASGRELDMGGRYNQFETAPTANASGSAAANRRLLVDALEAQGLVNFDNEWWHFSMTVPDAELLDQPVR